MKEKYFVIEWPPAEDPAILEWFTSLEEAKKLYRECVEKPGEGCEYYLCEVLEASLMGCDPSR